jgi:outer membrane protein OmpA-like peptidoglycan-associated protein
VIAAKEPDTSRQVAAKARDVTPAPTPEVKEVKPTPEVRQPEPVKIATATPTPTPGPTPTARPATGPVLDEEMYFSLNSARASGGKLDRAVHWLRANPDVHAAVEGYADPTGTPEGNMVLSQQRAESARDYLVAHGVDASRLDVTPYGDTKLKYGRSDGRNRRVEISAKR